MQIYNQNYTKTVTIVTQVFFLFMLKKSIYPKIQRNQNSYLYNIKKKTKQDLIIN